MAQRPEFSIIHTDRKLGDALLMALVFFGVFVPLIGWLLTSGLFIACWLVNILTSAEDDPQASE